MADLTDAIHASLSGAPRLAVYPDMVLGAAQTQDPASNAQVLAQMADVGGMQQAVQHTAQHHTGLLHGIFGGAEHLVASAVHGAGQALDYTLKPLHEVQHDYRYLHDLWTKSDPLSATLATLGVIGGTALGATFGGPTGAALGADAAMMTEGKLADAGAFNAIDPSYQQIYRQAEFEKISPGRDLAHLLQFDDTDSGWGKAVSGAADAAFDITMDPVAKGAGVLAKGRVGAEGLTGTRAARNMPVVRNWMLEHGYGGLGLADTVHDGQVLVSATDRIAAAWNNPQYRRALKTMSDTLSQPNGLGRFVSQHQAYARLAPYLGDAKTAEEIHAVFLGMARGSEASVRGGYKVLPSQTRVRAHLNTLGQKIKESGSVAQAEQAGLKGKVSATIRGASGYLPYTIDRATKDGRELLTLNNKHFDLMDPGALVGMYRSLKFTMGERSAQAMMHDVALAQRSRNVADVRSAWLDAHQQLVQAAGLPAQVENALITKMQALHADGQSVAYAYGHAGASDIGQVTHLTASALPSEVNELTTITQPMALWDYQASHMASFPDFWEIRNAQRAAAGLLPKVGGSIDEVIAKAWTNKIFKPLALVNMGFGLRVAASEALPAAFRYGALNMLQNRLQASLAKNNYRLEAHDERLLTKANTARESGDLDAMTAHTKTLMDSYTGHRLAAIAKLQGGMAKLLRASDEDLALAAAIVEDGQGQFAFGAVRAGHHSLDAATNATDNALSQLLWQGAHRGGLVRTGSYTIFDRTTTGFADEWHGRLTRMAQEKSARAIAADVLSEIKKGSSADAAWRTAALRESNRIKGLRADGTPLAEGEKDLYAHERDRLVRHKVQDPEVFGAHRADDLRNIVTGTDGTLHEHLLAKIKNGKEFGSADVAKISLEASPAHIPGQIMAPIPPKSLYSEAINKGFAHLVDPVINYLSREPMWFSAVKAEMPALNNLVKAGVLTVEQARAQAYYRATESILPQIHNVFLRSQYAMVLRNLMPFYFAQEQALKRTGHLLSKDPGALNKYQLIEHGLHNGAFVEDDGTGKRVVVLPLVGGLGTHLINAASAIGLPLQGGLPLTFTGNLASLATVLPEVQAPGVSPVLTVPLNEFAKFFPEWSPEVKMAIGERGFGQTLKSQLMPNQFMRNTLNALSGDESDRTMANAMSAAMTAAAARGELPDPNDPQAQQAFLDRIKNNARSITFLKGLVATFSPLSPAPVAEDMGLRTEFNKLLDSGKTYPEALQVFLTEHGNNAVSYTVGKTSNKTGAYLPSTTEALQWINDNADVVGSHLSAAYFVPENGHTEASGVVMHNEALRMGLRARETPAQFLEQMYVKTGMQDYLNAKRIHDAALANATDSALVEAENANWSDYVDGLKKNNVLWATDFTSEARNLRAQTLYADMVDLRRRNSLPASGMTTPIVDLMDNFAVHAQALATIAPGQTKKAEKDNWNVYLDTLVKQNPSLENVVNNIFRRLDRNI